MPNILNYRQYGEAIGLRWPFSQAEVKQQMRFDDQLKHRQMLREIDEPKDMTGTEFIHYINQYNQGRKV